MYLGKIVEIADAADLYARPKHPYTRRCSRRSRCPIPAAKRERIVLHGRRAEPDQPAERLPFHTRCPLAQPICAEVEPPLEPHGDGHFAACHFAGTPIPDAVQESARVGRRP